jgi:hypothetical protein
VNGLAVAAALAAVLGLSACGDDEDDDTSSGGTSNGGTSNGESGATGTGTLCSRGCVETLAAECENGPTTQAECETDCEALAAGSCGTEYRAFQACAEGEAISCSSSGLPSVEACADEQEGFVDCASAP